MGELELMRTFVRVVERGSLSAVAREAELGQATVSRHLKDLETVVGAALLQRTTRRLALTEAGAQYYERAKIVLGLIEQTHEEIRTSHARPGGVIRLSCTSAFGVLHLCRILFAFQDKYPRMRIDLGLTDERIDLVKDGADLVVRMGTLNDSGLVARRLGQARRVLVASPDYLARHGEPRRPRDLVKHNGIRFAGLAGGGELRLTNGAGKTETVPFGGDFQADLGLALREAFLAGRGLGPAHYWLVADLLEAGRLKIVLPEYRLEPVPFHVLAVPGRTKLARVRLLIDFLANEVAAVPGMIG
ncbi:MAG: transcriptional regulator, LysR family [Rhodospirillales bacterium]|nr:transcriptional regulator, LysR family [Rhodospirillales bacterium]